LFPPILIDIEQLLENPNSVNEGMEVVQAYEGSPGFAMTAPVLPSMIDFINDEQSIARQQLRKNV
jgi:hypothetical protein